MCITQVFLPDECTAHLGLWQTLIKKTQPTLPTNKLAKRERRAGRLHRLSYQDGSCQRVIGFKALC